MGLTRRVLIVTSSFAPAMIADMHRARMLAWELPKHGWDVEILTAGEGLQAPDYIESDSRDFFSPVTRVHSVGHWWPSLFRTLKMRSIGWRAYKPMLSLGNQLLATQRFHLVYFSTTQFNLFSLGPYWLRRFGAPFVLDFHDPWHKSEETYATTSHRFKSIVSNSLAQSLERRAVGAARGLVSVSPDYIEQLASRYESLNPAWLSPAHHAVIPFGALEEDLEEARRGQQSRNRQDLIRVIYVGVGGPIMVRSFSRVCEGLRALRRSGNRLADRVRVELFGTIYGWRGHETKHLEQVAHAAGVGDLVKETPKRVSYRQSLERLLDSDAAFVLGVDDAGYMPSKLFSYALSSKPLLASLHTSSPAYAHFVRMPELGHVLGFGGQETSPDEAARIMAAFLTEAAARRTFDRRAILQPYLAPAMAKRHAALFEACVA